jgi:hypothetical protein
MSSEAWSGTLPLLYFLHRLTVLFTKLPYVSASSAL